jgi:uncharacterized membrane protein (Fun14 family)
MSLIWLYAAAIFALINTVLITFLLSLYSTSYRKVRSTFTVGLIIFVLFFLIQNIVIIVFWFQLYNLVPVAASLVSSASPYMTLINLVETTALISLARVSLK